MTTDIKATKRNTNNRKITPKYSKTSCYQQKHALKYTFFCLQENIKPHDSA